MHAPINNSRRKLISTVGKASLALPLAYPLSSNAITNVPNTFTTTQYTNGKPARFLQRDFHNGKLELIRLLKEITEVEHTLMLQYLYAGFSLKESYSELLGTGIPDSHSFLGVAIQEMQHLHSINTLLIQLGASPNLDIQDFPYESDIYPFPIALEPLTQKSVAKYVYCEATPYQVMVNKDSTEKDKLFVSKLEQCLGKSTQINHVGSVYDIVINQLVSLAKKSKDRVIDVDYWHGELSRIKDEGEVEHFRFFKSVFTGEHNALKKVNQIWSLSQEDPLFPSHTTLINPSAYVGNNNQIDDPVSLDLAWMGNLYYWSVLILLDVYYRFGNNEARGVAISNMLAPMKSLGVELAKRGYGLTFDRLSLGYCPCQDPKDNIQFTMELLNEAKHIATLRNSHLPSDFPEGMDTSSINQLKYIIAHWDSNKSQKPSKHVSLMSG